MAEMDASTDALQAKDAQISDLGAERDRLHRKLVQRTSERNTLLGVVLLGAAGVVLVVSL